MCECDCHCHCHCKCDCHRQDGRCKTFTSAEEYALLGKAEAGDVLINNEQERGCIHTHIVAVCHGPGQTKYLMLGYSLSTHASSFVWERVNMLYEQGWRVKK